MGGAAGGAGGGYVGGRVFGEGSTGQSVLAFGGAFVGGGIGYKEGASAHVARRTRLAQQRQVDMLDANRGFNVSPVSWDKCPSIGRAGTYLSDQRAINDAIGALPAGTTTHTISATRAANLERAMGLERGSLSGGFKIRQVDGIRDMAPRSPLEGNQYFLGAGKHLPGGGQALVVNPIPTKDNGSVTTIMHILVR